MDDVDLKKVLGAIPHLKCQYFFMAIVFSFVIRFILSLFKASAHRIGETSPDGIKVLEIYTCHGGGERVTLPSKKFWKFVWLSFWSKSKNPIIDDHWIPFFVGLSEVLIFPIIFENNQVKILAGWFAIKILGQWSTRNSRTAINRFLLGNILSMAAAYFMWQWFLWFITIWSE